MIRFQVLFILLVFNTILSATPSQIVSNIHVDQFGYRENAEKIAVISQAQEGFNSPDPFVPGVKYELKTWENDETVFTGDLVSWKAGETHSQSGDKVWHFDFSEYTVEGEYYVWDESNQVGSYKFSINNDVYNDVLKQAVRTFYYQRFGFAKELPYAEEGWVDGASHLGIEQDTDCRDAKNPVPSTSRNLSGGWYDAGDFNKYMNYADETVNNLLAAYEEDPTVFTDDYNIPESANGVEDILDEVKYELDWMLRMQESNGSCIHKVSNTCYCSSSPPSTDANIRRYLAPTISATISGCVTFSHAALVYKNHTNPTMQEYGESLKEAAVKSWDFVINNKVDIPSIADNTGFVNGAIEDNEYQQRANIAGAAAFLFALTGEEPYQLYIDSVWNSNYFHLSQWTFASIYEEHYQDALLYYAALPNATSKVAKEIQNIYSNSISGSNHYGEIEKGTSPYLSYAADNVYLWGSSRNQCQQGSMYYTMSVYQLDKANSESYENAAENFIHYMHGVNPLNITYLTNMSKYGAENSITQIYHGWFSEGSAKWDEVGVSTYGPPPGFVPGGVNPNYKPDASCDCPMNPPMNQPILKSYKDWNGDYPENSWEVTENSISYQAAYIRLLSKFVSEGGKVLNTGVSGKLKIEKGLYLVPNPAHKSIKISGWQEDGTVNVVDQSGTVVITVKVKKGSEYHMIESLLEGVYIVKVTTEKGTQTEKLIIQ